MPEPAQSHRATLASDPARLRERRRWLTRLVLDAGFTPDEAHELAVAFSEACTNVHQHAYGGRRDGRVELGVAIGDDRVVVTVDHDGRPFDPASYEPPDLTWPSERGYGVYLLAALVDEVAFEGTGTGGRVILVKRRRAADARV